VIDTEAYFGMGEKTMFSNLGTPEPRVRQCWRVWPNGFDGEKLNKIFEQKEVTETQVASTFGDVDDIRKSRIAWLTNNPTVHAMLTPFISEAKKAMDVDVTMKCDIQYTEYHANEGGKYDWHHDVLWTRNDGMDRKLSLTVQLSDPSDYDGGDFEFSEVEPLPSWSKQQGTVMVFPSYLLHRVKPVTRGVRRSLVAWFEGPTWR
jgi:PKHD-type hydroxylase